MSFFGYFGTSIITRVIFPDFQTNPAKLILASTCHVNAAPIFIDGSFAHWTLLGNYLVEPLLLFMLEDIFPCSRVTTNQREVVSLSTKSTYSVLAPALHYSLGLEIDENSFFAAFVCAENSSITFLCIL